jgi:hypothetical protein
VRVVVRPDRGDPARYLQIGEEAPGQRRSRQRVLVRGGFPVFELEHVQDNEAAVRAQGELPPVGRHGADFDQVRAVPGPLHRRVQPLVRGHPGVDVEERPGGRRPRWGKRSSRISAWFLSGVGVSDTLGDNSPEIGEKQSGCNVIYSRRQSQFSVDCAQAHKGLFTGILVLAVTVISLIMFFELVGYKHFKDIAILQVLCHSADFQN